MCSRVCLSELIVARISGGHSFIVNSRSFGVALSDGLETYVPVFLGKVAASSGSRVGSAEGNDTFSR